MVFICKHGNKSTLYGHTITIYIIKPCQHIIFSFLKNHVNYNIFIANICMYQPKYIKSTKKKLNKQQKSQHLFNKTSKRNRIHREKAQRIVKDKKKTHTHTQK